MNILIPMAGLGSRFKQEGFDLPKPLIEVNGKSLIEHSVESLGIDGKYIFITRDYNDQNLNDLLSEKLKKLKPDSIEIKISSVTKGSAETCLMAIELIDNNDPLIITNCDQRLEWDHEKFIHFLGVNSCDGAVITHESTNPKHSYAKINKQNEIISLHEKDPVSKQALIGLHFWRKGKDFVKSAKKLIEDFSINKRPECYISETYNYLIAEGQKIKNYQIENNEYIALGTPYDLTIYKGKIKEFYTEKPKTIFCDIDGTILNHIHRFSDLNKNSQVALDGVLDKFNEWDSQGHKIILCTARKESARSMTEDLLKKLGFCWDLLIMGLTSGERVLINDKINNNIADRAKSVNLITNSGFKSVDWPKINL
jgi:dTDP-glucose pyrophosphorylase